MKTIKINELKFKNNLLHCHFDDLPPPKAIQYLFTATGAKKEEQISMRVPLIIAIRDLFSLIYQPHEHRRLIPVHIGVQ